MFFFIIPKKEREIYIFRKKDGGPGCCPVLRVPAPLLPACSPALDAAAGMLFAGTRSHLAKNVTVHNEPKDGS